MLFLKAHVIAKDILYKNHLVQKEKKDISLNVYIKIM